MNSHPRQLCISSADHFVILADHSACVYYQYPVVYMISFMLSLSSPVYQVEMLCFALICICDSLSCLGSSAGKSICLEQKVVGSSPT